MISTIILGGVILATVGAFYKVGKAKYCPQCGAPLEPTVKYDIHQCSKCMYIIDFNPNKS